MKAVLFYDKEDIRIEEIEKFENNENEILVKMEACAVCGTDMKAYYHGNPRMVPPIVMGHEFCGVIEKIGSKVTGYNIGERVVMATSVSCGECYYCKKGHPNLCASSKPMGFAYNGGMAEYIVIPELAIKRGHLIKVPLEVEPNIACIAEPLSCAVNSLQNVGIEEGDTVLVMGAGPLGILNLSVAKELGAAKTILAEVSDERLKIAEGFSVDRLVNSAKEDLQKIIMEETDGIGVDRVIVTAPAAVPQEQALSLVRKQGSVCLFASLPADNKYLNIDSRLIHYGELKVVGTSDSTPAQVEKAIEIIGRDSFPAEKIATHTLPLEDIKDAFKLMKDGVAFASGIESVVLVAIELEEKTGMYLLGIDNGSTMIKAVLFDMQGNQIDAQKEKVELLTPKPGYYERNLGEIWEANVAVIKRVLENSKKILGLDSIAISGLAITGHGNGLHLIDRQGNPLGNAIEGSDNRASQYVEKWYEDGTFEKAHPMIMQNLWAAQLPPLLAWFRDNRPEVLEEAAACLMIKDFVRYKLTGEVYVEMSDITGSSIMNVVTGQYDDALFELYGLKQYKRLFPEIRGGAEECGVVTQEAAELTGLTAGIPVAGGVFDIDGAALGTGVCDESIMNVIVGSWCNNQYITTTPPEDKDIFMVSRYVKDGYWLILEGSPTSASNLEWIVTEFLQDYQGDKYECANNALRSVPPQESEVIFVPYLYGSHTGRDSGACFLGVKGYHKREHILRAVFEGIAFSHRYHIEKLPLAENDTKEIRIAGGAVNSEPWMQIFADVLNKPIVVTAGTEIGALGAAICAGVAGGSFESLEDGIDNMVHVVQRIEPNPDNIEIYNTKYMKFRKGVSLVNEW